MRSMSVSVTVWLQLDSECPQSAISSSSCENAATSLGQTVWLERAAGVPHRGSCGARSTVTNGSMALEDHEGASEPAVLNDLISNNHQSCPCNVDFLLGCLSLNAGACQHTPATLANLQTKRKTRNKGRKKSDHTVVSSIHAVAAPHRMEAAESQSPTWSLFPGEAPNVLVENP